MSFNSFKGVFSKKDVQKGLSIPSQATPELAYLLGTLVGDGNICVRPSKNDYRVKCVGNPHDEKEFYNKVISPLFKSVFGIQIKTKYQDSNKTYGYYIYSKALVTFLTEVCDLPIGVKYSQLRIPTIVKKPHLIIHFLRGLADTDFCVTFKGKRKIPVIVGSSKSESFMKEASAELKKLGFSFYEVYNYKLNDSRFKSGYSLINKIEISSKNSVLLWMNLIGFSSPKHIEKIEKNSGERI